jgi:hypothetical protein
MNAAFSNTKSSLEKLELGTAVAMTAAACYLHIRFLLHAGGLWRDEVVSFNVASQPTIAALHEAVRFDSFPSFFHLVLRAWQGLGWGETDLGTRSLGFCIGLGLLAAFWWNARTFGARVPLFSLLLLGVSGLGISTTGAIRAYGIGCVCMAFSFGLIWKVATNPTRANVALAALAAVLSVQSLYQNAFFLGAVCLAGALITARHGLWKRAALILGIGAFAAISLTLYIDALQRLSEIRPLIARAELGRIFEVALLAVRDGSNLRQFSWLGLLVAFIVCGLREIGEPTSPGQVANERALFTLTSVVLALGGFFLWLQVLGFPTQPWYYVPPMAFVGLAFDAAWPAFAKGQETVSRVRVGAIMAASLMGLFSATAAVDVRQTNVDLIAARLHELVAPGDFILVDQWYNGSSFSRYFTGTTPWDTLPPLEDKTLQRLDQFKQYMLKGDATDSVERQIIDTLKSGHRVWVAGGLPLPKSGQPALQLPPAPNSRFGWDHDAYSYVWALQAGEIVQKHAEQAAVVPVPLEGAVNKFENLPLWLIQGWRENATAPAALSSR